MKRRLIVLVTLAGRRLAADGVAFSGSRYARRVLVLSATLTAAMVVGLLTFATSARADVASDAANPNHCAEKTASAETVTVGQPLTFTIRAYCTGLVCSNIDTSGMTDTLPEGLDFVSASATGVSDPLGTPQPTCNYSASTPTVTCAPVVYFFDNITGPRVPFVATIEVIPRQCGTFTNTASIASLNLSVSDTFTVEGCVPVPTAKEQCKKGGWKDFGYPDQGTCITTVNQNRQ